MSYKQICIHYLNKTCKYGDTCNKLHVENISNEIKRDINKKGNNICYYYPNCKFSSEECSKIHIDMENNDTKISHNKYEKDTSKKYNKNNDICAYYPNCKFSSEECKKKHIDKIHEENEDDETSSNIPVICEINLFVENVNEEKSEDVRFEEMIELESYYNKLMIIKKNKNDQFIQYQIDNISYIINHDLELVKQTYKCINNIVEKCIQEQ